MNCDNSFFFQQYDIVLFKMLATFLQKPKLLMKFINVREFPRRIGDRLA